METLRTVRNRISSVGKIKKIARAQEVVALTKLKRMETVAISARGYFEKIRSLLFDVAANINFQAHPFLKKKETTKTVALIVIFSDKGLCGNFNANVNSRFKKFLSTLKGKKLKVILIGKRGVKYLKTNHKYDVLDIYSSQDRETFEKSVFDIARTLSEKFLDNELDEIYLLYNKFKRHLLGEAKVLPLLPFSLGDQNSRETHLMRNYIYEPTPYEIFDSLIREYLGNQIQQGLLESRCAEEISRMLAMKAAGENADEMIDKLHLQYHKSRQAQITKELAEVVSAAELAV